MRQYNAPNNTPSDIGTTQFNTFYYIKKALVELQKEKYFGQLANVLAMPKNYGKTIKQYHYMPMLDDRNVNDQGIDASGVAIDYDNYEVHFPALTENQPLLREANDISAGGNASVARTAGEYVCDVDFDWYLIDVNIAAGAAYNAGVNCTAKSDAQVKAVLDALLVAGTPFTVQADGTIDVSSNNLVCANQVNADAIAAIVAGTVVTRRSGNLYGSSKDIGTITAKLPVLSETGGRVNRIGFKRIELEGSFAKFGFFDEYTKESVDFDTDAELMTHINREMIFGANEITEDALQIDLINGAGVIRYAGDATSNAEINGDTNEVTEVDYDDLMHLSIDLDNNRCPKQTTIITGSRMIDTKTIPGARVMFIGSEMIPTIEKMQDHFQNQAFIPVQHYADAGTILNGEIGTVGHFRVVVVPEMTFWAGAGAVEDANAGYRATNGRYDVYPMLVVGEASFTTIGFQTDGKTVKFEITHKKPGKETADRNDPYGETGFMSIKWYYGMMILRSERIALVKSAAQL